MMFDEREAGDVWSEGAMTGKRTGPGARVKTSPQAEREEWYR
jgi:hypothetical protein